MISIINLFEEMNMEVPGNFSGSGITRVVSNNSGDAREAELAAFMKRQRAALKEQSELPPGAEKSQKRLMFNRGEEINELVSKSKR